jgi:hypothetical protein
LHPLVTLPLKPATAAGGYDTWWIEASPERWDAAISVWWDDPPAEDS